MVSACINQGRFRSFIEQNVLKFVFSSKG